MEKKGLIFDVDGVLVDVRSSFIEATKKTIYDFSRRHITLLEIMKMKNTPGFNDDLDLIYAVVENRKRIAEKDRQTSKYISIRERFDNIYWGSEENDGTKIYEKYFVRKSTLSKLTKKYKLGIVTGRRRNETDWALRSIRKYFEEDAIITSDDTTHRKPSPIPIIMARDRLRVKTAIYIGDTINDFLAAKRAKLQYINIGNSVSAAQNISDVNLLLDILEVKI